MSSFKSSPETQPELESGNPDPPGVDQVASIRRGVILGMISATSYSAANLALRGLSGRDDGFAWAVWVTSVKALPTFVVASVLLMRRYSQGKELYTTRKPIPALILAALIKKAPPPIDPSPFRASRFSI